MSPRHDYENVKKPSISSDFDIYFNPVSLTKINIGSRMLMGPIITQFSSNKSNIEKCPPVTIMFPASFGNKIHSTESKNEEKKK